MMDKSPPETAGPVDSGGLGPVIMDKSPLPEIAKPDVFRGSGGAYKCRFLHIRPIGTPIGGPPGGIGRDGQGSGQAVPERQWLVAEQGRYDQGPWAVGLDFGAGRGTGILLQLHGGTSVN
jgi:hypothetical protein